MSTTYAPPVRAHRAHVNPWLVAVIGLAAALVALGAWVLVDRYTGGDTATQDATTLIDDFSAASSARDGTAAAALLTSDAVLWQTGETVATGKEEIANLISGQAGLSVERIAPVTINGDYATTFVRFSAAGLPTVPMLSVYQIKDGKIARIWAFKLGTTAPFDTAAR